MTGFSKLPLRCLLRHILRFNLTYVGEQLESKTIRHMCVCVCVCVCLCVCRFVCVCICAIQPYSIQYTHHIMCKRLSSLNRSRAFASFTTKYTPHTEGGTQTPPHTHTHTQTLTGAKEGRNRSGVPLPGLPFILLLVHGDFRRQGPRGRRAKARDVLHP